jgi:inorganic triphosphatase YgiF
LADHGVRLVEADPVGADPEGWLQSARLETDQDRRTVRRPLAVARNGRDVAEIALDITTFVLGIYEVTFREVEVESTTGDTAEILVVGDAIVELFNGRLRPSECNKHQRGLDLARRLTEEPATDAVEPA